MGTPQKFWQTWRDEEDTDAGMPRSQIVPMTPEEKDAIFSGDFAAARSYFEAMVAEGDRAVTAQDRTVLRALPTRNDCSILMRRFTVFEGGVRKIARHQQYLRHTQGCGTRQAIRSRRRFAKAASSGIHRARASRSRW